MVYLVSLPVAYVLSFIKIKRQMLLSLLLVLLMWWLMTNVSVTHSFDTSAYEYMYSLSPDTHRFEAGYMHMSYFFYTHGFSYIQFRGWLFGGALALLWISVIRFGANPLTFFSIFAVVPFFVEITQVRNFVMISIVIFGLSFLKNKGMINRLFGAILIVISSLFQSSGLLFLIIPILLLLRIESLKSTFVPMYFIATGLMYFVHYLLPKSVFGLVLSVVFSIIGRSNSSDAVALYSQGSSASATIGYVLAAGVIVSFWKIILDRHPTFLNEPTKVLFLTVFVALISIFLLAASADYERYIRNSLTITAIAFSIYEKNFVKTFRQSIHFWTGILVVLLISTFAWKYWDTTMTGRFQFLPYLIHLWKDGGF